MSEPRDWREGASPQEPDLPPELDPRGRRRPAGQSPARQGSGQVLPGGARPTRRQRAARTLAVIAMAMSVMILGVSAFGYVAYRNYDGNLIELGPVSLRPSGDRPDAAPRDARNILMVGSDTRSTTGEQFQGTGDEFTTGQRADTIIIAHLFGDSNAAQLVSFPRDSWVTIPEYTDPKTGTVKAAHDAKINSAISEGGMPLLVATLEDLTGLRLDSFVVIDFAGFKAMVDQLGGVEVCLLEDAEEKDSGINLKAGRQTVKGDQALAFVRQRKELPNGDIDRIGRQQHFIGSLTREVLSAGTLANPIKLNRFLDTATKNVSVDNGLSLNELAKLGLRLRGFSSGGVAFTTAPFTDISAKRAGQLVVLLDMPKLDTLFAGLQADRAPGELVKPAPSTSATAPQAGLFIRPALIRVEVYNGSGVSGLGRRVADDLAGREFLVRGTPGNRGTGASVTLVRHGPNKADSARTLAASIPGSKLELDDALGSTLEVVAGADYAGTVAVTIGKPPANSPAPTPDPSDGAAPPPLETAATAGCVN